MADISNLIAQGFDPSVPFARTAGVLQGQQRLEQNQQQLDLRNQLVQQQVEEAQAERTQKQAQVKIKQANDSIKLLTDAGMFIDAIDLFPTATGGIITPERVEGLKKLETSRQSEVTKLFKKVLDVSDKNPNASQGQKQALVDGLVNNIDRLIGDTGDDESLREEAAPQTQPQVQQDPTAQIEDLNRQIAQTQAVQVRGGTEETQKQAALAFLENQKELLEGQLPGKTRQSRFQDKVDLVRSALEDRLKREPTNDEVLKEVESLTTETVSESEEKARRKAEVKRLADLRVDMPIFKRALSKLNRRTKVVKDTIKETIALVSPFTSGVGSILSILPATKQRNLREKLQTIRANIGFKELREMRDASKTGGALGQISELENVLLQSVIASLDQGLHPTDLINNLNRIETDFDNTLTATSGFFDSQFSEVLPKSEQKQSDQVAVESMGTPTNGSKFDKFIQAR